MVTGKAGAFKVWSFLQSSCLVAFQDRLRPRPRMSSPTRGSRGRFEMARKCQRGYAPCPRLSRLPRAGLAHPQDKRRKCKVETRCPRKHLYASGDEVHWEHHQAGWVSRSSTPARRSQNSKPRRQLALPRDRNATHTAESQRLQQQWLGSFIHSSTSPSLLRWQMASWLVSARHPLGLRDALP